MLLWGIASPASICHPFCGQKRHCGHESGTDGRAVSCDVSPATGGRAVTCIRSCGEPGGTDVPRSGSSSALDDTTSL